MIIIIIIKDLLFFSYLFRTKTCHDYYYFNETLYLLNNIQSHNTLSSTTEIIYLLRGNDTIISPQQAHPTKKEKHEIMQKLIQLKGK